MKKSPFPQLFFSLSVVFIFTCSLSIAGDRHPPRPSSPAPGQHVRVAIDQNRCPVTDKRLDASRAPVLVQYQGFQFYVFDRQAADQFYSLTNTNSRQRNRFDVFKNLERNRDYAEPVFKTCPITRRPIDRNLYVQRNGRRIYVCSRQCLRQVERNWNDTVRNMDVPPGRH